MRRAPTGCCFASLSRRCGSEILACFLGLNRNTALTNFFKGSIPKAFAFRLDPKGLLSGRSEKLFPETPYGVYMVFGRGFFGFHVRFRDVARGGIRMLRPRDALAYHKAKSTLFEEN